MKIITSLLISIYVLGMFGCAHRPELAIAVPAEQPEHRQIENIKVALVLGGGGCKGLAHVGVLEVLEENNIPIDLIVGTSL